MTDLATVDDLEARLGRELSTLQEARAAAVLADVSAAVRGETGQQFTQDTTTDLLRVRRNRVRLPQRPVTDVTDVTAHDGIEIPWEWDGFDVVRVWTYPVDTFEYHLPLTEAQVRTALVTYEHGYETIPADILGVVCSIAERALGQDPTMGGIISESISSYSYSIGSVGASGPFGVLQDERRVLERYKRKVGYVDAEVYR